jgi:hypothetical protein
MAFGIIIRGKNQPSENRRFRPHFNRSICDAKNPNGTYIGSYEQYKKELKDKNLVPYDKNDYKDKKEKEYKPSKEAHEAVQHIKDTKGNPGGGYYAWLEKKGITKNKIETLKRNAVKYTKGGKDGFQND